MTVYRSRRCSRFLSRSGHFFQSEWFIRAWPKASDEVSLCTTFIVRDAGCPILVNSTETSTFILFRSLVKRGLVGSQAQRSMEFSRMGCNLVRDLFLLVAREGDAQGQRMCSPRAALEKCFMGPELIVVLFHCSYRIIFTCQGSRTSCSYMLTQERILLASYSVKDVSTYDLCIPFNRFFINYRNNCDRNFWNKKQSLDRVIRQREGQNRMYDAVAHHLKKKSILRT